MDIPKFMLSGSTDEFFMMDDYDFFFDDLPGEKHMWYLMLTFFIFKIQIMNVCEQENYATNPTEKFAFPIKPHFKVV